MNMKGNYNDLNCRACKMEEESQSHILKCDKLNEGVRSIENIEGIIKGNLAEKIRISKKFEENFDKLEKDFVIP